MKKLILFTGALAFNIFIACQSPGDEKEGEPYETTDTNRVIPKNSPEPDSVKNVGSPNGSIN